MSDWPPIGLEEARKILKPRMPQLADALRDSMSQFNEFPPVAAMAFDDPTKWMCMNRLWYFAAQTRLTGVPGVVFDVHKLQRYVMFDERCLVRHKHFDDGMLARNYPTAHNRLWMRQGSLDGILPVGRLDFGYRLDVTGTRVQDAFITLPYERVNLWVWQIWGEEVDTFAIPQPLFPRQPSETLFAYDDYSQAI
jgi:hypothetical protein